MKAQSFYNLTLAGAEYTAYAISATASAADRPATDKSASFNSSSPTKADNDTEKTSCQQVPSWAHEIKHGIDRVQLDIPGVNRKNVTLRTSGRNLFFCARRYIKQHGELELEIEYIFKMRLANNSDSDAITTAYKHGVFTVGIPRSKGHVANLVPAHAYYRRSDLDEVLVYLPGVRKGDTEIVIDGQNLTVRALRYAMVAAKRTPEVAYCLKATFLDDCDLKAVTGTVAEGVLKINIPRTPPTVKEVKAQFEHERVPGMDYVRLNLPGVKDKKDVHIESISKRLFLSAKRFHGKGGQRKLHTVYKFEMSFAPNNDIDETSISFADGMCTLSIPRRTIDLTERAERLLKEHRSLY